MTTTVKIEAHAWPVRVTALDNAGPGEGPGEVRRQLGDVEPNSTKDFHVHSARKLLIEELPARLAVEAD